MESTPKYATGIKYGIIISLCYCVLLFIRYNFFAGTPLRFGLFAGICYLIVLVLYLFAGIARRKEQGGYAEIKEIFQTIFIAILITELVFVLFNYVYVKYIDPSFFDNFRIATRTYMEKSGLDEDKIDKQMEAFKDMDKQFKPINILKGYGVWVLVDSVFGLIYAAILKKKRDIFDQSQPAVV